ncbi:hypothetical protein PN456_08170 [Nodularia spumigena CS-586/05]|uniref:hypothetical protein n=1 Tax=Nodularia spumigena TaxID=70799 RepID=UPI00232CA259|nr:hypothetical protein [Nodularia spumigena]MDB9344584.1 hypothetical protein [Nodularia spumigena CS-588/06]MDB9368930.1 hypothetical protein [Nodularia spumigena CS-586/05]
MILIDTDVLIDFIKNPSQYNWLIKALTSPLCKDGDPYNEFCYSIITAKEMLNIESTGRILPQTRTHFGKKIPFKLKGFDDTRLMLSLNNTKADFLFPQKRGFWERNCKIFKKIFKKEIKILQYLRCLPLTSEIENQANNIIYNNQELQTAINNKPSKRNDILIGVTSLHHNFPVVTRNIKDFSKIPKISIIQPREMSLLYAEEEVLILQKKENINYENNRRNEILILKEMGLNDKQIIKCIWKVTSGNQFKLAKEEYKKITNLSQY